MSVEVLIQFLTDGKYEEREQVKVYRLINNTGKSRILTP
jgi:hypothetical protein